MMNQPKTLPPTAYAVLGLLSFGAPRSGYEIRQWATTMRFFYWSPAQSQVYRELRRLAAAGLVTAQDVAQDDRPDKRVYTISPAGRDELARWLAADTAVLPVLKHPVALKLYFGHMTTPDVLAEQLERYLAALDEALGQLAVVQEYSEQDEQLTFPALVARWGYHYYEAEQAMAREVLSLLRADKAVAS